LGLILSVLGLTGTTAALQSTIVVPLLAEFSGLLHTSTPSASWFETATFLAGTVSTPIVPRLADICGKKPMMLGALGSWSPTRGRAVS
jgi:MFS family permease